MDLNLIALFVEIVESHGFAPAARKLKMSKSNISQRLKVLERDTGAQLVRRSTRSFELTEAGQALYASGRRIVDELDNARASIDTLGHTLAGRIRVSVPTGIGRSFVGSRLREFVRMHPAISLTITFNNRIDDLIASEIDIALRIGRTPPLDCVAHEVCSIDWILCASVDYLRAREPIERPSDLASQVFIGAPPSQDAAIELRSRSDDTDAQSIAIQPILQSADYPFLIDAVLEGMGIGILPTYAMSGPFARNLEHVLPQYRIVGQLDRLYLLTLPNRFHSPAKRALMEYLKKELTEFADGWKQAQEVRR